MSWYFQQNQCLKINKTAVYNKHNLSWGPYDRGAPGNCPACPCVKTVLGQIPKSYWNPCFYIAGEAPSNEKPVNVYPTVITQSNGEKVLVVQDYTFAKYLGVLQVEFDDSGKITSHSGNPILLDYMVQKGK